MRMLLIGVVVGLGGGVGIGLWLDQAAPSTPSGGSPAVASGESEGVEGRETSPRPNRGHAHLQGELRGLDGLPLSGVQVEARAGDLVPRWWLEEPYESRTYGQHRAEEIASLPVVAQAVTDRRGRFHLQGLAEGLHTLELGEGPYRLALDRCAHRVWVGDENEVVLLARRPAALVLDPRFPDGERVPPFPVLAMREAPSEHAERMPPTEGDDRPDARFTWSPERPTIELLEGRWTLVPAVDAPVRFDPVSVCIDAPGHGRPLPVLVRRRAAIVGRVRVLASDRVRRLDVHLLPEGGGQTPEDFLQARIVAEATRDVGYRFVIGGPKGLRPGRYRVAVSREDEEGGLRVGPPLDLDLGEEVVQLLLDPPVPATLPRTPGEHDLLLRVSTSEGLPLQGGLEFGLCSGDGEDRRTYWFEARPLGDGLHLARGVLEGETTPVELLVTHPRHGALRHELEEGERVLELRFLPPVDTEITLHGLRPEEVEAARLVLLEGEGEFFGLGPGPGPGTLWAALRGAQEGPLALGLWLPGPVFPDRVLVPLPPVTLDRRGEPLTFDLSRRVSLVVSGLRAVDQGEFEVAMAGIAGPSEGLRGRRRGQVLSFEHLVPGVWLLRARGRQAEIGTRTMRVTLEDSQAVRWDYPARDALLVRIPISSQAPAARAALSALSRSGLHRGDYIRGVGELSLTPDNLGVGLSLLREGPVTLLVKRRGRLSFVTFNPASLHELEGGFPDDWFQASVSP